MSASIRHFSRRWLLKPLMLCLPFFTSGQVIADNPEQMQLAKVKTAYLFNIAKFVAWPENSATVALCIDPKSILSDYISKLDGRNIDDSRKLRVILQANMLDGCNIFYTDEPVAQGQNNPDLLKVNRTPQLASTQVGSVLTISDHEEALDRGYAMQFHLRNGKLRFKFSQDVLARSLFKVSSKLLILAGGPNG